MPEQTKETSPAAAELSHSGDNSEIPDLPTVASMRQELQSYEMPTFGTDEEITVRFQTLSGINQIKNAPDWLLARTPTMTYRLIADSGSEWEQELELSYNEYESVKLHLASMRGYTTTDKANDVLVNAGVDINYQGISLDESGSRDRVPDDEELLRMDAEGDEVLSVMPPMDIGSTVNVLLHHEVDPLSACRLLRKIAAIIETKGISRESWECHTQHPTVVLQENHIKSLRITFDKL